MAQNDLIMPTHLDVVFDVKTHRFSVTPVGGDGSRFALSVADAKNLSEVLDELSSDPDDCTVARIWLDPAGKGGYVDYR